jgi:hypothetical protein
MKPAHCHTPTNFLKLLMTADASMGTSGDIKFPLQIALG